MCMAWLGNHKIAWQAYRGCVAMADIVDAVLLLWSLRGGEGRGGRGGRGMQCAVGKRGMFWSLNRGEGNSEEANLELVDGGMGGRSSWRCWFEAWMEGCRGRREFISEVAWSRMRGMQGKRMEGCRGRRRGRGWRDAGEEGVGVEFIGVRLEPAWCWIYGRSPMPRRIYEVALLSRHRLGQVHSLLCWMHLAGCTCIF